MMVNISDIITKSLFEHKVKKMILVKNDPYISVYPILIEHIKRLKKNDLNSMISISHIIYGWMPTILTCNFKKSDMQLYKKIKIGSMDKALLEDIKRFNNNSIIGGSKFLHFVNPHGYAIWDLRVYRSITGEKPHGYRVNNIENYIQYNNALKKISANKTLMVNLKNILMRLKYCNNNATELRILELILFYTVAN